MKKQSPLVEARSRVGKLVKSAALLVLALLMAVSSSVSVHGAIKPPREPRPTASQYNDFSSAPPGYKNYNCYGYAVGKKSKLYPGQLAGYPKKENDGNTKLIYNTYIPADLQALGYRNIRRVSASYQQRPGETMIAVIVGDVAAIPGQPSPDELITFHAWVKYSATGPWYHKFGADSAIMKMRMVNGKWLTPADAPRTDEHYDGTGKFHGATFSILSTSGSIAYFAFTTDLSINEFPLPEQEG